MTRDSENAGLGVGRTGPSQCRRRIAPVKRQSNYPRSARPCCRQAVDWPETPAHCQGFTSSRRIFGLGPAAYALVRAGLPGPAGRECAYAHPIKCDSTPKPVHTNIK